MPTAVQAVPRVLTLYCEHGSDQLARQAARVGGGGAQRSSRETKANNDVGAGPQGVGWG